MFKTSTDKTKEGTILRTHIIQISFCQFSGLLFTNRNLQKRVSTFTESNHEQANQTAHRSSSCYVIVFNCCRTCSFSRWKKNKTQFKFHGFHFQLRSTQKAKCDDGHLFMTRSPRPRAGATLHLGRLPLSSAERTHVLGFTIM